jgi:glycerol transport system ATP-binding protein
VKADKVQIGVLPEFAHLARSGPGLPVAVRRVEDVGRFRIIRATCGGKEIAAIAPEGAEIDVQAEWMQFDPKAVNVYADGWLVEGEAA